MFGKPSTMLWPGAAALMLAISWLLPNHTQPWRSFHQEAWAVLVMLGLGAWLLWQSKGALVVPLPTLLLSVVALVPWMQWMTNLIASSGQAYISSGYLLCCAFAILLGYQAHQKNDKLLGHVLFSAIAIASMLNVSLQLFQWLAIYDSDLTSAFGYLIWEIGPGDRPSGNILQPNLLATLLVWGAVAGLWAFVHKAIRWQFLLLYLGFIGFGLGLTQSRIGVIELVFLAAAAWYWRHLLPPKCVWFATIFCLAVAWLSFAGVAILSDTLLLSYTGRSMASIVGDSPRLIGYTIFIKSVLAQPMWGYGLTHLGDAYLRAADTQIHQDSYFLQAHNLFLDVFLWFGIPLGLSLLIALGLWLFKTFKRLQSFEQVVYFCCIFTFFAHGLVELPYQYMYFLIPVSLFAGALCAPEREVKILQISRFVFGWILLAGTLLWAAVIFDYLRAEDHFNDLRFEMAKIGRPLGYPVPEMLALNQLENMMLMQRMKPATQLGEEKMTWMNRAVRADMSPTTHFIYVGALALNGRREEAVLWMHKLNAVLFTKEKLSLPKDWAKLQKQYPELADMPWAMEQKVHRP